MDPSERFELSKPALEVRYPSVRESRSKISVDYFLVALSLKTSDVAVHHGLFIKIGAS
jgi:hypothetical protein